MKNATEYYTYDQLPAGSIRLLKLHGTGPKTLDSLDPGTYGTYSREHQLEVSLESFKLSECPAYIALSYTWGLPGGLVDPELSVFTPVERVYPIYCDAAVLLATWNLRAALRRIRYATEVQENAHLHSHFATMSRSALSGATYLWIDALCINQSNLDERAVQVQIMGKIYKQARITILWLGEIDKYTGEAFKVLSSVKHNLEQAQSLTKATNVPTRVQPVSLNGAEMRACIALLNRKWFQRNWTIQEVLLSKNAFAWVGDKLIGFTLLERGRTLKQLQNFRSFGILPGSGIDGVDMADWASRAYNNIRFLTLLEEARQEIATNGSTDFVPVIYMCRYHECSDPRDKIYSVLAICRDLIHDPAAVLVPDYNEDVYRVYLKATTLILRNRQDLLVLHLSTPNTPSQMGITRSENLPSWCPDYRVIATTVNTFPWRRRSWKLETSKTSTIQVVESILQVSGQCIGLVAEKAAFQSVSQNSWVSEGIGSMCSLLTRLGTTVTSGLKHKLQNTTRIDLFSQTLLQMFPSALAVLAGVDDTTELESSLPLLLPILLRQMLLRYIIARSNSADQSREQAISSEALTQYGSSFESALYELRKLEQGNELFLPISGQITKICEEAISSAGDASYAAIEMNRDDLETWPERARAAGLDLPASYLASSSETSVTAANYFADDDQAGGYGAAFNGSTALLDTLTMRSNFEVFRTDNHLLGLASCILESGDQLWILHGAHAPFFLRPLENGNYRYLGETYMRGLMDGEAVPLCRDPVDICIE